MSWNEAKPAAGDSPDAELTALVQSNKTAFRIGVEQHSFWTDSSGVSAGIPRLSYGSAGPGAARAFFDVASNASSQVSATKALSGRLYVTSDTTQLLGYTSGNTIPLGGADIIVQIGDSTATIAQNSRWLEQVGTTNTGSVVTVAFPTAYSVAPKVYVQSMSSSTAWGFANGAVTGSTTTNFTLSVVKVMGSGSAWTWMWRSIGTVAL